jgi:hypothetical protein
VHLSFLPTTAQLASADQQIVHLPRKHSIRIWYQVYRFAIHVHQKVILVYIRWGNIIYIDVDPICKHDDNSGRLALPQQ